jgi:hypothetical protein
MTPPLASSLVAALAGKPAGADALKRSILETLGKSLKAEPEMSPALTDALKKLLTSGASDATLPLVAKWDKDGKLKTEIQVIGRQLLTKLNDGSDADRLAAARGLIGLRGVFAEGFSTVTRMAQADAFAAGLRRDIVLALGETGDPGMGTYILAAFPKLDAAGQAAAFDVILKRKEWSFLFLRGVESGLITTTNLGPANVARLRTHPDPESEQTRDGAARQTESHGQGEK